MIKKKTYCGNIFITKGSKAFPFFFIAFLAFVQYTSVFAQKKNDQQVKLSPADMSAYTERVKQMIQVLETSLNLVGDDSTSLDDKQAVIDGGYLKIFRDEDVKIEDDLDEKRSTPVFKNVPAYLRDVDYFFKGVAFSLHVDNVGYSTNSAGKPYFKVTVTRKLRGVGLKGDSINNKLTRFIEFNILEKQKDLKIVSIYTTRYNETEELKSWWHSLPVIWRWTLARDTTDSASTEIIAKAAYIEKLNLHGKRYITTFEPLTRLQKLKELNLSGTQIVSIEALRYLGRLEKLNISNTPVKTIDVLGFSVSLKEFYADSTGISTLEALKPHLNLEVVHCGNTNVSSILPLSDLKHLRVLYINKTRVSNLGALRNISSLEVLNCSNTRIDSLGALVKMNNLKELYFEGCPINNIHTIRDLQNLNVLDFSNTFVSKLPAIEHFSNLERIYCERSLIKKTDVVSYRFARPKTIVIFETEHLQPWWNGMDSVWRSVFKKQSHIADSATKEQLAALVALEKIDVSGNKTITTLSPLSLLSNLQELYADETSITSLNPIGDLSYMRVLDFANTKVNSLWPVNSLNNLIRLNCNNTGVDSLQIRQFSALHPHCLVIYRSTVLNVWWNSLSEDWKNTFHLHLKMDPNPTEIQLHKLVMLDSITINNSAIKELNPLIEFQTLRILKLNNTQIKNLQPLSNLKHITYLQCSKAAVSDLNPLKSIWELSYLDISNTAVSDLTALSSSNCIKNLNISSTKVDDLEPLKSFADMEVLECSNTPVKNLKYVENCKKLNTIICYNTRIKPSYIKRFNQKQPNCKVVYY